MKNLQEMLTVPHIFLTYSGALQSCDYIFLVMCDFSAPEYVRKMCGTVKISCRFLIFHNLWNILNFPQLFQASSTFEYSWLSPVIYVYGDVQRVQ